MTDGLDKRTSQSATCPYLAQEALYIYVVSDMSPFMSMTVSHGMHILLGLGHLMTIGFGTCTTSHYLRLASGGDYRNTRGLTKTINVRESGSDQSGWSSHLSLTA